MTDRITPEQEAALVAAEKAATLAPWHEPADDSVAWDHPTACMAGSFQGLGSRYYAMGPVGPEEAQADADATFIARARNSMPALLAELAALREELLLERRMRGNVSARLSRTLNELTKADRFETADELHEVVQRALTAAKEHRE